MKKSLKVIVVVAILVFVCYSLLGLLNYNSEIVMQELLQGKPIGVLTIIPSEQMPEQYRKTGELWAKYTPLNPEKPPIPLDGSYAALRGTIDVVPGCAERVVSAGVWFHAFMPLDAGKMAGDKVAVYTIGIFGIGPCGVINTTMVLDSDYNPKFKPDDPTINIWNIPNCWLRLKMFGGGEFKQECMQGGFYPTDVVAGIGPSPRSVAGSNGVYVYYAYADGVWPHAVDAQVLQDVIQTGKATPDLISLITNFLTSGTLNGGAQ